MTKKQSKKKKYTIGAVIAVIGIGLAIAVIVLALSMKSEEKGGSVAEASALTLDDFLHGKFAPKSFNGSWVSGKTCSILCRFLFSFLHSNSSCIIGNQT